MPGSLDGLSFAVHIGDPQWSGRADPALRETVLCGKGRARAAQPGALREALSPHPY